jgi:MarR family transcriptional regulator, organic hydroperoxide resistance regulator
MTGRDQAAASGPLGYALATAARSHRTVLQAELAALGLHLGQELVVVDLAEHPDSTQVELVARLGVEQPTVAKTIARMERAGLVRRSVDTADRRQSRICLTPKGRKLVEAVTEAWSAADQIASQPLSSSERRTLVRLLQKLSADARRERSA